MKNLHLSYLAAVMGLILMAVSCGMKHESGFSKMPEFRSVDADVQEDRVVLTAAMSSSMGIVECGFFYSLSEDSMKKMVSAVSDDGFEAVISDLEYDTEYLCKAYAGNGRNFIYSELLQFRTASRPEESDPDVYFLSLPFTERYVPAEASSFEIEVGGNADFVVEPNGSTDGVRWAFDGRKCTFHIEKNPSSECRDWLFVFKSLDHEYECNLGIYQVPGENFMELSTYELVVGPENGAYNIEVFNCPHNGAGIPPDIHWMHYSSAQYGYVVCLSIDRNPKTTERTGQICVLSENGGQRLVTVIQKGAEKEIPELVTVDLELPYDADGFQVAADNIDPETARVRIPSDIDWVQYQDNKGNTYNFSLQENRTGEPRTAKITIQDRFLFSCIVNLSQAGLQMN